MAKKAGWWRLIITGCDIYDLSDNDIQRISTAILEGYRAGEIVEDEQKDEGVRDAEDSAK